MLDWSRRQQLGAEAFAELAPAIFDKSRWSGAPVTVGLAWAFAMLTGGWVLMLNDPEVVFWHADRLWLIHEHFHLDWDDLANHRYHVLFTHAFLYDDLLHTLFMLFALLTFGSAIEWKYGSVATSLLFLGGVLAGAAAQMLFHHPVAFRWLCELAASEIIEQILRNHQNAIRRFSGPAGGVWALMLVALVGNPRHQSLQNAVFLYGYAVLFILADWFGFFHFGSSVAYAARAGGVCVAMAIVCSLQLFRFLRMFLRIPTRLRQRARRRRCQRRANAVRAREARTQQRTQEVDRVLEKLAKQGRDSLTRKELDTLLNASRDR